MSRKADESVKVFVRVRPIGAHELRDGNTVVTKATPSRGLVSVTDPKANERELPTEYFFDAVFDETVEQKHIFNVSASGIIESVLKGYNGTVFAYGQTGAGKTHTMEGKQDPPEQRGIMPNSFQYLFDLINTKTASSTQNEQYLVRVSYLEIYKEEVRDLLGKNPEACLELKESPETGVYVKDLSSVVVKNVTEIDHVFQRGKSKRSTGSTDMNEFSSRSHAIFTIVVESVSDRQGASEGGRSGSAGAGSSKVEGHIKVGRLNLVDLAGSEKQSQTNATGERLAEAIKINQGLTVLGNCIKALVSSRSTHVPFRESQLTRLLQNSLGGNAKTVMIANCGPADKNYAETLTTLRYANRAKNIKNKPTINEDPKDAMLREYQEQIRALREQLQGQGGSLGNTVKDGSDGPRVVEKIVEKEVVREVIVNTGITAEQLDEVKSKAHAEKQMLLKQAADDIQSLLTEHESISTEKSVLKKALEREESSKRQAERQRKELQEKLKEMEETFVRGTARTQSKLSRKEQQLMEKEALLREKQIAEAKLARDLAVQEEANLQLEEHYSSLQEEVEVKTRKLRKLWAKYQSTANENKELQEEFEAERTEMLATIQQLTCHMRVQQVIISNFIPEERVKFIESNGQWNEDKTEWILTNEALTGNALRRDSNMARRPISSTTARRPESEFAKQRRQFDERNPRYRAENVAVLDLDQHDRTVQDWQGDKTVSKITSILNMDLETTNVITNNKDIQEDIWSEETYNPASPNPISHPYGKYDERVGEAVERFYKEKYYEKQTTTSSARPKSASRRREPANRGSASSDMHIDTSIATIDGSRYSRPDSDYSSTVKRHEGDVYSQARGLVRK